MKRIFSVLTIFTILATSLLAGASSVSAQTVSSTCYNFEAGNHYRRPNWFEAGVKLTDGKIKEWNDGLTQVKAHTVALQRVLEAEGFTISAEEKSAKDFGLSTAQAVSMFQNKYKAETLTPKGFTTGHGVVDSLTNDFLSQKYGCLGRAKVNLISPEKAFTAAPGQNIEIKYSAVKIPNTTDLEISYVSTASTPVKTVITTISGIRNGAGTYSWAVPSTLTSGEYKLQLVLTGSTKSDVSDKTFKVQIGSLVVSPSSSVWKIGEEAKFTITKSSQVGNVSVTAVPQTPGQSPIILISSTDKTGEITLSDEKTKLLTAGSYKLRVASVSGVQYSAESSAFNLELPGISVATPSSWTVGNVEKLTITKSSAIGAVQIVALPQSSGSEIVLVNNVTANGEVTIPASATSKLANGSYKIIVRSVNTSSIFATTNAFNVSGASISITLGASEWKIGEVNKATITKTTGVGAVSINAVPQTSGLATITIDTSSNINGELTIPSSVTKQLIKDVTYKIVVRSLSNESLVKESDGFKAVLPGITVTTPTSAWVVGNQQTVTFSKSSAIGAVSIKAVSQSGGAEVLLENSTNTDESITIPKDKTKLLSAGSYKLVVTSLLNSSISASSEAFNITSPSITVTLAYTTVVKNKSTTFGLMKSSAVGALSIVAVPQGNTTAPSVVLITSTTDTGTVTISAAATNKLTLGVTYKLRASSVSGIQYTSESNDTFVVSATASVTQADSSDQYASLLSAIQALQERIKTLTQ